MHIERRIGDDTLLVLRDDLSPEDTAMLQALYSRSAASVLTHLAKIDAARREAVAVVLGPLFESLAGWSVKDIPIDEVIAAVLGQGATVRAGSLMRNHYVGYNHKSIGDCGTTTLWIEGVSLLAAKAIQDNPLYAGQETSTRYIDMQGRRVVDPIGTPASRAIIDRWMTFYAESMPEVVEHVRAEHPRQPGEPEDVYERAVRARAFDITRGFLPAGVTTQLSWHTNLRQAGDKLATLRHHLASEMQELAVGLHGLLTEAYPSSAGSLGTAGVTGVADRREAEREAWTAEAVRETTYWTVLEEEAFATTVFEPSSAWWKSMLATRPRGCVVPHVLNQEGQVLASFLLDFGSYRDVQRHRAVVCPMPLLTTRHGFEPWYLEQLPTKVHARAVLLLADQERALAEVDATDVDKQYLLPLGYRVPCHIVGGLPGVVYLMEVRASKTVHPTLRRAVHKVVRRFQAEFPGVALHVDLDPDDWTVRRGTQTITRRDG